MRTSITLAAAAFVATVCPVSAVARQSSSVSGGKTAVTALIWAKEQAIYAARGRGDLEPYINAVARDYQAWPPFRAAPAGVEGLHQLKTQMVTQTSEKLEMHFVSLSLNGDAAVIYYQTHRTVLPDGTQVDERFDVTHSWVREGGTWKVLGGMARPRKP